MDKLIKQTREVDVWELLDKQEAARSAGWGRLAEEVSPGRYNRLTKMAETAATAAQNRELVRSEIIRSIGVAREMALKIGGLTELGEDVFFLEFEEIEELLQGDDGHKEKILSRKIAFERYRRLPTLPNVISGTIDLETWEHNFNRRTDFYDSHKQLQIPDDDVIRGFPGAAGVVEGTVRVLAHHDEADLLEQGEILVASFTNVGWTPIFPKALAIITDIGAPLSHAAIVARELGIPSVVGTGNATMKLKTGDRIRVDGGAGIVERL